MNMEEYEVDLENIVKNAMSLSPFDYQYYKGLKNRTIILNDVIDSCIFEKVTLPLLDMDNDGSGKQITIYLSTIGGTIFDGMGLCDVIDNLKTKTNIIVPTYAFSMGSLILMAGYNNPNVKKYCYKHSTALIHAGNMYLEGSSMSVKDTFEFHQKYEEEIEKYTLTHSNITQEEYDKLRRCEKYMLSDEMLEKGLVDEIL